MKANEIHYFSNLFDKDRSTVHHQEYLNNVYTRQTFVMLLLLPSISVVRMELHPDHANRRQQN